MTTRPKLKLGVHLVRGLAAVALFGVLAAVFLAAEFPDPVGFEGIESITAGIGYAIFDVPHETVIDTGTDRFLVAFLIIAVALDAALEGAVLLARREEGGEFVSALRLLLGGEQ